MKRCIATNMESFIKTKVKKEVSGKVPCFLASDEIRNSGKTFRKQIIATILISPCNSLLNY